MPMARVRTVRIQELNLAAPENFPQRLVHFQSAIVVNKSLLPKPIHEGVDPRARGTDHVRQNLVTQAGNLNRRWTSFLQVH